VEYGGRKSRVEIHRQKLNAYLHLRMWEPNRQGMRSREGFCEESNVTVCDVDNGETTLRIPEHSPRQQLVGVDPRILDQPSFAIAKA
jgi:hypothetical protein